MSDFKAKQQKILDAFGIGNVACATGNSSDPLGSCREACDEGCKRIWDRIDAVLEKVQPFADQPVQVQTLGGGE
ncbi:hypothetical protein N1Z63_004456 [Pseudomonas aeruginosa]|uniref:hypothetical protein n=1 Tax=Pseudomonas aeruginosa TaxID=287 RepID=UPI000F837C21|nr:hypothetical protein [Pseudomonas aeruginosa]EIU2643081.1 hypothetical protein [Pseudomonas aeruginosa]EIU9551399.1 hypothetical protein [Pseudomonas aeruginosa]EJY6032872.1 hypothetical protein [Pseudomonas aeruginosa]EKM9120096.1 hypothetical protein [Pseudomonas aeruginosa]EKO0513880.1 hypothetical protein [Pseudomonas aeruginosa]